MGICCLIVSPNPNVRDRLSALCHIVVLFVSLEGPLYRYCPCLSSPSPSHISRMHAQNPSSALAPIAPFPPFAIMVVLSERQRALAYFYRHPPAGSGARKQKYNDILNRVAAPGKPKPNLSTVKWAVNNFHDAVGKRGRKLGWRKTTGDEDKAILAAFHRARQPLGSAIDGRDVWNALPDALRRKVSVKTVKNRLAEKGFAMDTKLSADDKGAAWRKKRLAFCKKHQSKTSAQWYNAVQAVADFRYFKYFPKKLEPKQKRVSCKRTIMSKAEKKRPAFLKPRVKDFDRAEFKRVQKAKVFGITSSDGQSLIRPCPLHPTGADWVKLVRGHVGPFMRAVFPGRRWRTVLLDGEGIMHTPEAKLEMERWRLRPLPGWPASSPDLNPQENVWAWTEKRLRKVEKKSDSFPVFKRRAVEIAKQYPSGSKLVPGMCSRMALCIHRSGANIGK